MKKRIEKVVECIDSTNSFLTKGKKYVEIPTISSSSICVVGDNGREAYWSKERFKVVSEREILEFEEDDLLNPYFYQDSTHIPIKGEIDLTNYDLKVIAAPKDKRYGG